MAEEVYAVFGLTETSAREEPNRKAGKEGEVVLGAANTEDAQGVPFGLHNAKIVLMKAENKADLQKSVRELFPAMQTSNVFYIKKANLEK